MVHLIFFRPHTSDIDFCWYDMPLMIVDCRYTPPAPNCLALGKSLERKIAVKWGNLQISQFRVGHDIFHRRHSPLELDGKRYRLSRDY
jgi:hypothetical protein